MIIFFPDRGEPQLYNWANNSTHSTNCATVSQISDIIYFITTNCTEKHSYECEQGYTYNSCSFWLRKLLVTMTQKKN